MWFVGCGVLVGLHSCLTFLRGAAAGPFVRGCETERWTCVSCPILGRVVAEQGQYLQQSIVYFLLLYLGVCPRLLYTFSVLMEYGYVNCEKLYMKCGVFLYVYTDCGLVSLARLRPVCGRRTQIKCVIGLTGLAEAFRHKYHQSHA
ncbi:hypothetical protein Taro_028449 [Colocasia esculenta]|uniref:Secreted protein n=1 Tax=Colocasia esculenta TaxID=4460 RepID=A0A843VL47_COLES|nr:hypothetical protein [Colocasia esculenta]